MIIGLLPVFKRISHKIKQLIRMCVQYIFGMDIKEAIWRNHYQIVVTKQDDVNAIDPVSFGSAFLLKYKEKEWLITADHVIHPDVHAILDSSDCNYYGNGNIIPEVGL